MRHPDSETLVLVAMAAVGLSQLERTHLEGCAACARELRELRRSVATGGGAGSVELAAPSEELWGRIHGALGLSQAVAELPGSDGFGSPRPSRRWGWLPLSAAAAVAGLLGGSAVGIWWQASSAPDVAPVVASAMLAPESGWEASGRAWVEKAADGHREIVVQLETAGEAVLLREVWLVTGDASGLISVGFLDGGTGRFTIPDGIDPADYPLVDVSAEFDDGDSAHSGDSIVRGELQ